MGLQHRFRRVLLGATLASIATLGVAGAAAAHECYNASRSSTGDTQAASKSAAWTWASEVIVRYVIPGILGDSDGLTAAELDEALAIIEAERDAGVVVYELDRALLSPTTAASGAYDTPLSSDGLGIDHATNNLDEFEPLVWRLIDVYLSVTTG